MGAMPGDRKVTERHVRGIPLAVLALALLTAGCGRAPVAPTDSRVDAHSRLLRGPTLSPAADLRIVVRLEEGTDPQGLASAYGAVVVETIPALGVATLSVPAPQAVERFLESLEQDPAVVFAERDLPVHGSESLQGSMAFDEGIPDWDAVLDQSALSRIRSAEAHSWSRGRGVVIAILDTGIDLDHPSLRPRLLLPGIELGAVARPGDDRAELVDTNLDGRLDGSLGHGTHVAGIAALVAPEALLLPVRVLDSDGVGRAFEVARGLVDATLRGATVVNMSLGVTERARVVEAAIDFAHGRGVLIVAPAGNQGEPASGYPASYGPVLSVAGLDADDRRAAFSNYGPGVDLAAPSVGILSTHEGGDFAAWSGTSMAAPFVAGAAAILVEQAGGSTSGVPERILSGASSLAVSEPTFASGLGAGRLDVLASVLLTAETTPLPIVRRLP